MLLLLQPPLVLLLPYLRQLLRLQLCSKAMLMKYRALLPLLLMWLVLLHHVQQLLLYPSLFSRMQVSLQTLLSDQSLLVCLVCRPLPKLVLSQAAMQRQGLACQRLMPWQRQE